MTKLQDQVRAISKGELVKQGWTGNRPESPLEKLKRAAKRVVDERFSIESEKELKKALEET